MTPEEAEAKYRAEWPALNAAKEAATAHGEVAGAKRARQLLSRLSAECSARHGDTEESASSIDLERLQTNLKTGEYDGVDVMRARIAIGELRERRAADEVVRWRSTAPSIAAAWAEGRDERIAALEHEISETRAAMVLLRKQIDEAMCRG